ncbi:MAG: hypothetical protein H7Y05_03945 [Steroidobacteraceae bacterium]|nr:hypothetical protein [Deltaproteobacteria bacterium]
MTRSLLTALGIVLLNATSPSNGHVLTKNVGKNGPVVRVATVIEALWQAWMQMLYGEGMHTIIVVKIPQKKAPDKLQF